MASEVKVVKFRNQHKLPALHKALSALPRTPLARKLTLHVNVPFALSRSILRGDRDCARGNGCRAFSHFF